MSLPYDHTQDIIDYACQLFNTDNPTIEQLETAQKAYEDLIESNMKNVGAYDTN